MSPLPDIILILLLGVTVGWIATRVGLPAVIGQVLLGIVIGPPVLGWINPGETLNLLGEIGVVLLLGVAGLHLGLRRLVSAGWPGLWVALLGMAFCLAGGYVLAIVWGSSHEEAVYVGTAMTATSIGISVQVLQQFGLIDHAIGRIVVAAAIVDDVVALYLLALAHGILGEDFAASQLLGSAILAALILTAIFLGCKWFALTVLQRLARRTSAVIWPVSVLLIIVLAWLTAELGYSLVVGGFFAGLGLGEGLSKPQRERLAVQVERMVLLLVPFFFVLIGSRAEWRVLADQGMPLLIAALLVVAIGGKVLGGLLGALGSGGFMRPLMIRVGMVPRGEVALVIAGLGFEQAHISHHMLVALVLMTIGAALVGPLLLTPLLHIHERRIDQ